MSDQDEGDVRCTFECDATSVKWQVMEAGVSDVLNRPYEAELNLGTSDLDADPAELLGQSCTIEFKRDSQTTYYSGIVSEIEEGSSDDQWLRAKFDVVAALGLLAVGRQTRIFQNSKVTDILQQVLSKRLGDYDRKADIRTQREYPVCEYRLQYDESDLDFCHRLMEEEGIAYWFEQDGSAELLVLSDDPQGYPEVESVDGSKVPFQQSEGQPGRESIRRLDRFKCLKPTKLTMRHFDWTRPMLPIEQEQEGEEQGDVVDGSAIGPLREDYEHDIVPPTICDYDSGKNAFQTDDSKDQVSIRRQLHTRDATTVNGDGAVLSFAAGRVFELTGHPRSGLDDKYLITSVSLSFATGGSGGGMYENRFAAIPASVAYRPARKTPRPQVKGIETATVVGPQGQEIFTDEHGRVKVQFHWDREGNNDDHSSCFMRVTQPWAGAGWGFVFLPRIGMEVTVAFVHGDPDRPIITGTVYNGQNPTSYPMPDEMTKSTIRTRSSPGGDGYNELTFEDKAGEEEVFLQAQRNLRELVKTDHSASVGNDQSISVSNNQSLSVSKDQTIDVGNDKSETVNNNKKTKVAVNFDQTIGSNVTQTIGTDLTQTVGQNKKMNVGLKFDQIIGGMNAITVGGLMSEKIGASRSCVAAGAWSATAGLSAKLQSAENIAIKAQKNIDVSADEVLTQTSGKEMTISAKEGFSLKGEKKGVIELKDELTIKVGSAQITMKKNGDITIKGKKINIKGSGDVVIKGSKIGNN